MFLFSFDNSFFLVPNPQRSLINRYVSILSKSSVVVVAAVRFTINCTHHSLSRPLILWTIHLSISCLSPHIIINDTGDRKHLNLHVVAVIISVSFFICFRIFSFYRNTTVQMILNDYAWTLTTGITTTYAKEDLSVWMCESSHNLKCFIKNKCLCG